MTAVRLSYELAGPADAPVLVLANSLGTTSAMWDPQVPTLAQRFRLLRYDHRGHGSSDCPTGPYTIDDLGGDLAALLDTLGLDRVSLCGLSLGGMVGMWLAAHEPARVERLVLCCTSACLSATKYTDRAAQVRAHGTASVVDTVVSGWFTDGFRRREPDIVARAAAQLVATPDEGYAGCCEAIASMDLRPALRRIGSPTLVLAGGDDVATPVEHAELIVSEIPDARLEVVPGAAHLANIEQPRTTTELIRDHLLPGGRP